MDSINLPSEKIYKQHLQAYSQYTFSEDWIDWAVRIIPYRAKRLIKTLQKYTDKDDIVLELGSGIGLTLHILAQAFPNTIGFDISQSAIDASRELLKKVGLEIPLYCYDGKKLPFKSGSFDVVTAIDVIEHAENQKLMLSEIKRVLNSDGIVLITTPNKFWPLETHYRLMFLAFLPKKIADKYVSLLHRGTEYDVKPLSYGNLLTVVSKFFKVEDITLDIIKDDKEYGLDKERGRKVVFIANLLSFMQNLKDMPIINSLKRALESTLLWFSEGWVLIGKPQK